LPFRLSSVTIVSVWRQPNSSICRIDSSKLGTILMQGMWFEYSVDDVRCRKDFLVRKQVYGLGQINCAPKNVKTLTAFL
jgi:hypothetical protein